MGNMEMYDGMLAYLPVRIRTYFRPPLPVWRSPFYQLLEVQDVAATLFIDEHPIEITPYHVALIPSQTTVSLEGRKQRVRAIQFESSFLMALTGSEQPQAVRFAMSASAFKHWQKLWSGSRVEEEGASLILASVSLFRLLSELLLQSAFPGRGEEPEGLRYGSGRSIIYAARYIKREMANPDLSLESIAQAIGYHPNYFCQEFKRVMSITPMKYVARVRLEKALYLLRTTEEPIQRICQRTGIKKSSSLSTLVKSKVGMTPVEYRRFYKSRELRLASVCSVR